MTSVAYIAPAVLPSRAANGVHVALQCEGLVRAGADVTLYAKRAMHDEQSLPAALGTAYGIDASAMRLVTYFSESTQADTLRIALLACRRLARQQPDVVLSRNLYAAYWLGVIKQRPLLFETHQLETGFRKHLQRAIMLGSRVTTVVISAALTHYLTEHHGVAPRRVLVEHDAAREGIVMRARDQRRDALIAAFPELAGSWALACGYFGHLFPGRGIEIIEAVAAARPRILFAVFGGNDSDVRARRAADAPANLRYLGFVPHPTARYAMGLFDALLMPYQPSVSIGVAWHDTARWMSPMKMFEYLATGVPIVSSDLPVLREVLQHERNALLAAPADPVAWLAAIDRLVDAPEVAQRLGIAARGDYLEGANWTQRARRLIAAAGRE